MFVAVSDLTYTIGGAIMGDFRFLMGHPSDMQIWHPGGKVFKQVRKELDWAL